MLSRCDGAGHLRPRTQGSFFYKGDDYREWRALAAGFKYTAQVRSLDEKAKVIRRHARFKARRQAPCWLNLFRRLLARWRKRADTYLPKLHLALGAITCRKYLLGEVLRGFI